METDMHGLIGGGQGRKPQEVKEDAFWFAMSMIAIVVILIVAIAGALGGS